jgi:hypothetical protein
VLMIIGMVWVSLAGLSAFRVKAIYSYHLDNSCSPSSCKHKESAYREWFCNQVHNPKQVNED